MNRVKSRLMQWKTRPTHKINNLDAVADIKGPSSDWRALFMSKRGFVQMMEIIGVEHGKLSQSGQVVHARRSPPNSHHPVAFRSFTARLTCCWVMPRASPMSDWVRGKRHKPFPASPTETSNSRWIGADSNESQHKALSTLGCSSPKCSNSLGFSIAYCRGVMEPIEWPIASNM